MTNFIPKRFDCYPHSIEVRPTSCFDNLICYGMKEIPNGKYVLFEDYEKLKNANELVEALMKSPVKLTPTVFKGMLKILEEGDK